MLSVDVMGSVMSLCLTLSFAPRGTPMFIADRINFLRDDQEVASALSPNQTSNLDPVMTLIKTL